MHPFKQQQMDMDLAGIESELAGMERHLGCDCGGGGGAYGGFYGAGEGQVATGAGALAAGAGAGAAGAVGTSLALSSAFTGTATAGAAGAIATGGVGAGLAIATVAAPAALVAGGAAWALSWRVSQKNIARLKARIRKLETDMKLAMAAAGSDAQRRRLKNRYERRINYAKKRLDRAERVLTRRIQRARRWGNDAKVERLKKMRRAAKYGIEAKRMQEARARKRAEQIAASTGALPKSGPADPAYFQRASDYVPDTVLDAVDGGGAGFTEEEAGLPQFATHKGPYVPWAQGNYGAAAPPAPYWDKSSWFKVGGLLLVGLGLWKLSKQEQKRRRA